MAPNPQTVTTDRGIPPEIQLRVLKGDEIVISGMSGIFPKCENTMELMENLYNKVDMVKEVKCDTHKHPALSKYIGKMPNIEKFDAQFFRVTPSQAASLDPLTRKAMENAFGAIYDSGINPITLSGTKLGVFIGSSYADSVMFYMYSTLKINNFVVSGCSKTMQANRISYWIDGKGPSVTVDQGCSSSMTCLELAYQSMKRGDCEAAIVGGSNSCVCPGLSVNLRNAGHLCLDGKTKSFDKNGDGYVRSEAVNILFLQRAKDAKRIYAEIYHIKGKFFTRPDANFLYLRKPEDMEKFWEEFYSEIKVSPSEVEYVEAHGLGINEADGNELDAIGRIFANSQSIKVGSFKSNIGHTEGASGVCSITKMCLAYQKGELPANLHYNEPQDHVSAVHQGKVQVVTVNAHFNRGFTAINNYSHTGSNHHVLLKGIYKNKDKNRYKCNIPRIILLSGRDEEGINKTLDILQSQPIDPEQIALLHNIYNDNIPGHTGRSYVVLDTNNTNETICLARSFQFYSGATRPVCFLYSGMGSQWNGMGTELMRIPIFSAAIERCCKVLNPLGVDLVKILTDSDKTIFDCILNSMVGISAIQIGLTDVLKAMGIVPDTIIGHSIGELGCAYADGCFTAEEMILSSYYRGLISIQTPFIKGSMAAVGLGHKDVLQQCPPEIHVACHNSANSSTIAGPFEAMNKFVSDLTSRGIFAREVACSNIAYHSKYVSAAGPGMLSSMKTLIQEPRLRSEKWISTSVPQENWDQEDAKFASAEYFTANLLSPVLFEENASLIPKDAVMIEIAPHGLLQAIMRKSHSECVNIPLTKRACPDPVLFFLEAVGKVYHIGANPKVDVLYPKVEFPVSTETPLLSHLIKWEHSFDWPLMASNAETGKETSAQNFVISVHDDEYKFLEGYVRNGINEVPETALLVFVWETFGMYSGKYYKDMSVTFYDVTFHCQLKIQTEDVLRFKITMQHGSNKFELINGNTQIVTGCIKNESNIYQFKSNVETDADEMQLSGQDVYTLLRMKGYCYGKDFQNIHALNNTYDTAYIKWTGEWTTFLDSLLQLNIFARDHDGVSTPKIIKKLSIHVDGHKNEDATVFDHITCYKADISKSTTTIRCGGVEVSGIVFDDKLPQDKQPDVLLVREFIPHELEDSVPLDTAISISLQLVRDNVQSNKVKVVELLYPASEPISSIEDISRKLPCNQFDVKIIAIHDQKNYAQDVIDSNLLVSRNLLGRKKMVNILNQGLEEGTFVLTLEQTKCHLQNTDFKVILTLPVDSGVLVLMKKETKCDEENVTYIQINQDSKFSWLSKMLNEINNNMKRVVFVSERQPQCGLLGLVKLLKKYGKHNIGLVIVDDYSSCFDPLNPKCKEQMNKKLAFNVLKKEQWGGYYYVTNHKPTEIKHMALMSKTNNDLDNFSWVEIPNNPESRIQVSYAGLSSKDYQKAIENTTYEKLPFGMDFSGIDKTGGRVMGMVAGGALSSTVEADSTLIWPVPEHWTLQEAATVPLPYVHAYYCLVLKGSIKEKQRIFITGGAGALGQAVISICLSMNCEVFTTVRDEKMKRFLLRLFPKLKGQNITYSHQDSFFMQVRSATRGQRCDIVINSSSESLREAAMNCVAAMGIFLDVTNIDFKANRDFGMSFLVQGKNYKAVNVSTLFKPENESERKVLQSLITNGIANGTVRPLSRVLYSPLEVSRAFKLVSSSRHIGRALIRMSDSESLSSKLNVTPSVTFSNGVHIVICDKNNFGVELTHKLIKKGATKIIVHMRKSYSTNYFHARAKSWEKFNITIELNSENLEIKEGCEKLLKAGQKSRTVTSIFIVQDYKNKIETDICHYDDFKSVVDETVMVTANLDMVSRSTCDELRNFVILSASSLNVGSEYATSACDKICETRKKLGLPALVLRTSFPTKKNNTITNNNLLLTLEESTLTSLFNAMDISMKCEYNNVLTFNLPKITRFDVFEKLQRILGAIGINNEDETLTLNEINVNDLILCEIKSEISQISLSTEELGNMTVSSLKNLCSSFIRKNTMFDAGIGAFYYSVERNEYEAVDAYIPMKTKLVQFMEDGYLDRSKNELIMIPGFDGHHQIFKSVAERLKIRATTLQLGPDITCDSIPEMAKYFVKIIKSQFETYPKFYILGYSFGVNVALEVAKLLEAEGRTGVVYCLDSSPDALKLQIKAYMGYLTDAELQNAVLIHMCNLMTGQECVELKQELEKSDSWPDKIEICVKKLRGLVHFSIEHRRSILETAYKRILLANEYEPDFKLESELVLMKGIPHPKVESLAEDYNLSKYTKQPVKVFYIESDHVAAPYDNRVSNIVNKMLDPDVLEEFKRRKLC